MRRHIACTYLSKSKFQFTHPGRGATLEGAGSSFWSSVSIHAPREGCDSTLAQNKFIDEFQFTHPGRGATLVRVFSVPASVFQFTHPGRGATIALLYRSAKGGVSIHAPREGCDLSVIPDSIFYTSFNSRTPGGVRQYGAKLPIMGRINKRNLRLAVLL